MKELNIKSWLGLTKIMCFSLCLVLFLLPSVSAQAEQFFDPDSGLTTYEFHVQGKLFAGTSNYDFDYFLKFIGNDISFYSAYTYYINPNTGLREPDNFSVIAFSKQPFTISRIDVNDNNRTFTASAQGRPINNETVYCYFVGISGSIENNLFGSYVGAPNLHFHEHDSSITGTRFINSLIDELCEEFVTNGGLDWEVDESVFDNFYLTGLSMENTQKDSVHDVYSVRWTGTSLGNDIYSVSNGLVTAYWFLDKDDGSRETFELSSSFLTSGQIVFDAGICHQIDSAGSSSVVPDGLGGSWNGKIYLLPTFDYNGMSYQGAYAVVDTRTNNIYNVTSDSGQTITWNDFFLSNVRLIREPIVGQLGYYKISWTGTTRSADLIFVPDVDTLVVAAIALEDAQGNIINQELASTTIGRGYFRFDMEELLDQDLETAYYWDGMIYLMPTFTKDGNLYMGQFTVVDTLSGDIYQDVVDVDDDTIHREPVGSGGSVGDSFGVSSMSDYISTGFNFLSDLIRMMGTFPALVTSVFQFLPDIYINAIGVMLIIIFIGRVLGR